VPAPMTIATVRLVKGGRERADAVVEIIDGTVTAVRDNDDEAPAGLFTCMSTRPGTSTPSGRSSRSARPALADHTKWGVIGISTIAALDEADVVVTDARLRPDARAILTERVGDLLVCLVSASPRPASVAEATAEVVS